MIKRIAIAATITTPLSAALLGLAPGPAELATGSEIYSDNRGRHPISISVAGGDFRPADSAMTCAACHGDFGEGGAEGGVVAPALTMARTMDHASVIEWLRAALGARRNRDGRTLDLAMPHYRISDPDIVGLAAYITTFPDPPVSGLSADKIRIAIDTTGSELSDAGVAALRTEMNLTAADVWTRGGIFGRALVVDVDGAHDAATILIRPRAEPGSRAFVMSLRADEGPGRCGSVDPTMTERVANIAAHFRAANERVFLLGEDARANTVGAVVVVGPDIPDWHRKVQGAKRVIVPAHIAAADASAAGLAFYAPGDLQARSAAGRELVARYAVPPRDAILIAVYREALTLVIAGLREQGRRMTQRALCERLVQLSLARRLVSFVDDGVVKVLGTTASDLP